MASHQLSKSSYIRGLQCAKSLYLHVHRPFLRDKLPQEQLARFARGTSFGIVARDRFPGGIALARPGKATGAKTGQLIEAKTPVIYEACFLASEVLIALDILVLEDNQYLAFEVKSSLVLRDAYFEDAALQYYVMGLAGCQPSRFFLLHPPEGFQHGDEILPGQLQQTDVTSFCKGSMPSVKARVDQFKNMLVQASSPDIAPDAHCLEPYPCDFRNVCWKKLAIEQQLALVQSHPGSYLPSR